MRSALRPPLATPSSPLVHLFLDETGFDPRSTFAAFACAVVEDATAVADEIVRLREKLLRDPFLAEHRSALPDLRRRGFHYASNHRDVRHEFIELLIQLPFQAYVCFVEKPSPFDRRSWLDRLLGRLLFERLRAHRACAIDICFEQTDSRLARRVREVTAIVETCVAVASRDRGGLPGPVHVRSAGKEEPCLSVADYVCGVVRTYLEKGGEGASVTYPAKDLARLRPKIRVVHDYLRGVFYTRRNPLP